MYLDYDAMPYTRAEWNRTLLEANSAIEKILSDPASAGAVKIPENLFFLDGIYPNQHFSSEVMNPDSAEYKKAVEHLTSDDFFRYYIKKYKKTETGDDGEYIFTRNDVVGHVSPADIAEYYIKKYELSAKDGDGNPLYTDEEKTVLMKMYYRLEEATFGPVSYTHLIIYRQAHTRGQRRKGLESGAVCREDRFERDLYGNDRARRARSQA